MHGMLFVFALGYCPFLFHIFGEKMVSRQYSGPRTKTYWLDFFLPYYRKERFTTNIFSIAGQISYTSWYTMVQTNVEFAFRCVQFVTYFAK